MVGGETQRFEGKRILLLQGPVGPFFRHLRRDLRAFGAKVFKINFNGGDLFYYPWRSRTYRGRMDAWGAYLEQFLIEKKIDTIFLFGDCRPLHREAIAAAGRCGIRVGVFEEGYIRPDYITFEYTGVNGHSTIPRDTAFYRALATPPARHVTVPVGNTFSPAAWKAVGYYAASILLRPLFFRYRHHRPLTFMEGIRWLRSFARKRLYRLREHAWERLLLDKWEGDYFLAPLQVAHDAQIRNHSPYQDVTAFIRDIARSFARHAPPQTLLVIKHHPMDRAYTDYTRLIQSLRIEEGLGERLVYIHDQHLPSLLEHARGVVVINSTVGLSALHHGTPTKTTGRALYDIPGLTYQGTLDTFWQAAHAETVDKTLYHQFLGHLIGTTQINGSFYRRLQRSTLHSGIIWNRAASDISETLQPDIPAADPLAKAG